MIPKKSIFAIGMKIIAKYSGSNIVTNYTDTIVENENRRFVDTSKLDYLISRELYCKENNVDKIQHVAVIALRRLLINDIKKHRLTLTNNSAKYTNFKLNRYGKYEVNCRLSKLAEALYLINNESRSSKFINELRKRDLLDLSYQNYETMKNYIYNANFGRIVIQGKLVEELISLLNCNQGGADG